MGFKKNISILSTILGIILIIFYISTDEIGTEDDAINMTQNYGKGHDTILYWLRDSLGKSIEQGNSINVTGWSSSKLKKNTYNVTFEYTENGKLKIVEFQTNTQTGRVVGINKMANDSVSYIQSRENWYIWFSDRFHSY